MHCRDEQAMGRKECECGLLLSRAACRTLFCFFLCIFASCGSHDSVQQEKETRFSIFSNNAPQSRLNEPGRSGVQQREAGYTEPAAPVKPGKPIAPTKPGSGKSPEKTNLPGGPAAAVKIDINNLEIVPPRIPGQPGATQAEIKARRESYSSKFAPDSLEVIPPSGPGQPGITQGEVNAARNSLGSREIEADLLEIAPPKRPGDSGATQAEINAITGLEGDMKHGLFEVIPPDRPGGSGVTQAEIAALRALQPGANRVLPPDFKNPAGK